MLAAICSLLIPGLGQLVQGRLIAAFGFFVVVCGLYALGPALIVPYVPAAILHLWCIINAARYSPRS